MTTATQSDARFDRRLDERRDCLLGLSRWLESARKLLNLDALALADSSGCLVAGAGSVQRCEEMAALAPVSELRRETTTNGMLATTLGSAWLCAPGEQIPADFLQHVRRGCVRILGWKEVG